MKPGIINRTCGMCGKKFRLIPDGAKLQENAGPLTGWYWNCECRSTMFYRMKMEPWPKPEEENNNDDREAS